MKTTIIWGGPPLAWPRTRGTNRHLPEKYRAYRNDLGWEARLAHDGDPWDGHLLVGLAFAPDGVFAAFRTVEDASDAFNLPLFRERPKGLRGDLDNYVKAVLDACQGIVYRDDRQVVGLVAVFLESILDVNTEDPE